MEKMYTKAIIKQIGYKECINNESHENRKSLLVKLEGVEGFILKCKKYKEEIKSINDKSDKDNNIEDNNIFVKNYDDIFCLQNVNEPFYIQERMEDLIKEMFVSQNAYIFEIDETDKIQLKGEADSEKVDKEPKFEITSIRKCD